jgi:methylenetetrahydrofolate reductase (NADPH)
MIVSLEAVPRSPEALATAAAAAAEFPAIALINIPDLLRFSIRSWEACGILAGTFKNPARRLPALLPHLRACDFDPEAPFPHVSCFRSLGIDRVLVIAGDPPDPNIAASRRFYPAETVPFIKKLKNEMPELQVYGAFDPYRTNIRYELDYLAAKKEAGAGGFFSQPFFDLRLLEIYAEYLEGTEVFWGVSPVLSEASRNYWESRNRAVFPKSFRAGLSWNVAFGRRVLGFCKTNGFNLYLMPIKVDLGAYLSGVLGI